jgi:hypothetical protein
MLLDVSDRAPLSSSGRLPVAALRHSARIRTAGTPAS